MSPNHSSASGSLMTRRIPWRRCGTSKLNRCQFFHTLHFDDEAFFDDEVDAICDWKLNLFVHHRQMYLALNVQATACQFIEKTRTNRTFEHSGAERSVDGQRALEYRVDF